MKTKWMIYGANGYSATLALQRAIAVGERPILAGRSEERVRAVAKRHDLDYRVFNLSDTDSVVEQLADVAVISHCAGPYRDTAKVMMDACIRAKTHYTDITGEIDVFLHAQTLQEQAEAAGVVIMPGVGLDIVPTDCLAKALADALPDANSLVLGIDGGGVQFSPGTAKTAVSVVAEGMKVVRDGKLISVPRSYQPRRIDFGNGEKDASVVPWGDLGTAHYLTGIPNISVYMPARIGLVQKSLFPLIQHIMSLPIFQRVLLRRIDRKVQGPSAQERSASPTFIWGEVTNEAGRVVRGKLRTANGYSFTSDSVLFSAKTLLEYDGPGGFFTPSQLMGTDCLEHIPGTSELVIE